MDREQRIFVAGHQGLVGSALLRKLEQDDYTDLLTADRNELDLLNQSAVRAYFSSEQPEYVILAAAKVGGIHANNALPAEFIRENLVIQTNVIHTAWQSGVQKLCFLGSSCIYPKLANQPLKEEYLLTGPLEETNDAYAIAKIAGIKMCQAYRRQYGFDVISLMPTNLYGPGDNFHPENSHVLPALIRRIHEAKESNLDKVVIWGTGTPRREFLHVDDLADAVVFLMQGYSNEQLINVGVGEDVTILELAQLIADIVGFTGTIDLDPSRPDGTPQKLLDVSRLSALGWQPRIGLRDGIESTYRWFQANLEKMRDQ